MNGSNTTSASSCCNLIHLNLLVITTSNSLKPFVTLSQRHKNVFYNLIGLVVPALAAILLLRYLYTGLGSQLFGTLTLMWAITGYLSFFDLGLGRATTLEVSQLKNRQPFDKSSLGKVFYKGVILGLIVGLLTSFFLALFIILFPLYQHNAFSAQLLKYTNACLALLISIPFVTVSSVMRGGLEGLSSFKLSSINRSILGLLVILGPCLVLYTKNADAFSLACSLLVARVISFAQLIPCVHEHILISPISFRDFRSSFRFGSWVTVSSFIGPFMVYGDKFLISYLLGSSSLGTYSVIQDIIIKVLVIPAAVSGVIFPLMTAPDSYSLKVLYSKAFNKLLLLMVVICLIMLVALPLYLTSFILDTSFITIFTIVLILLIGIVFNSIGQLPLVTLYGLNKPNLVACIHMFEIPLYAFFVYLLTSNYGLIGASVAWTGRVILDFFLLDSCTKNILRDASSEPLRKHTLEQV